MHWNKITDKLPDQRQSVLFYLPKYNNTSKGYYMVLADEFTGEIDHCVVLTLFAPITGYLEEFGPLSAVSHWACLPKLPNNEEETFITDPLDRFEILDL